MLKTGKDFCKGGPTFTVNYLNEYSMRTEEHNTEVMY